MMRRVGDPVGSVAALWRYPVKSMLGESVASSEVGERGLAGDRAFGLLDVELGKLATAKRPRLWGRLLEFRAGFEGSPGEGAPVVVTLPDGSRVRTDDPEADARISAALGRELRLATEAPAGLVFDEDWLGDIKGEPYGPVVDGAGFPENEWSDRVIEVGDQVRLQGVIPVPRCVMTTLAQGDLPRDSGILRAAAERNRVEVGPLGARPCAGVYMDVVRGGVIRAGDPVTIE